MKNKIFSLFDALFFFFVNINPISKEQIAFL